jgi:hypothetical protein
VPFIPPIKNADLIERALSKLEKEHYDEQSMMVKLCI